MIFYKYVSAERIDILQNSLIRFTQPNAMNDPFEARPHFDTLGKKGFASAYAEMIRRAPYRVWEDYKRTTQTELDRWAFANQLEIDPDYAEQLYKNLGHRDILPNLRDKFYDLHNDAGILSLSETPDNLLMWAHYAEGHTGFVLMLDGSDDFFKGKDSLLGFAKPERVEYRYERPRMAIEETSKEVSLREIFFVKGLVWEYEKEWRYLKDTNDSHKKIINANNSDVHLFRLPPKCIIGVILGCYSSEELANKICKLRLNNPEFGHLQILQARTSETHYGLEIKEIET